MKPYSCNRGITFVLGTIVYLLGQAGYFSTVDVTYGSFAMLVTIFFAVVTMITNKPVWVAYSFLGVMFFGLFFGGGILSTIAWFVWFLIVYTVLFELVPRVLTDDSKSKKSGVDHLSRRARREGIVSKGPRPSKIVGCVTVYNTAGKGLARSAFSDYNISAGEAGEAQFEERMISIFRANGVKATLLNSLKQNDRLAADIDHVILVNGHMFIIDSKMWKGADYTARPGFIHQVCPDGTENKINVSIVGGAARFSHAVGMKPTEVFVSLSQTKGRVPAKLARPDKYGLNTIITVQGDRYTLGTHNNVLRRILEMSRKPGPYSNYDMEAKCFPYLK